MNNTNITKLTPYTLQQNVNNKIIPLHVYQTWYTKNLPPKMNSRWEALKHLNPEFTFHLYDDNDCEEFIKKHFTIQVLNAYNSLIPGAYKADLWRYCVLFVNGGIYMDIKLLTINGFKLIELTTKEHYVRDRPLNTIYNALIVCKPRNKLLLNSINMIVRHVRKKYYGLTALDPTGPGLIGKLAMKDKTVNIDLHHYTQGGYILYKKHFVISTEYSEYDKERSDIYNKIKKARYNILWNRRAIYK
jgi:mannosyltransferase OCH1-like enzyme